MRGETSLLEAERWLPPFRAELWIELEGVGLCGMYSRRLKFSGGGGTG